MTRVPGSPARPESPARPATLGSPRLHLRVTDSTNTRARELAAAGAPAGMLVTAAQQTAGRGRQGRSWSAPPGRALLCSLIVAGTPPLLSLAAGVAVAEVAGPGAQLKWPNDVVRDGRKLAGILTEGRPQEAWAVLGIGINVALRASDFPPELRQTAGTLGLEPAAIEPTLTALLGALERWLFADASEVLEAVRARDVLLDRTVRWTDGEGVGAGIDDEGRLLVRTAAGREALTAGEVHLAGGAS
ncbi:MAG TPA: biotin--[acetyl-CoA-carboxylase] ligase [Solirubrobacteraceae bacterium]|jgi:BirA family biotin operon repressor/biotin-[acetyl-CoA-carboxylase] ligase|nr:biotin--[acetyl-CoA-carboxylase] ligase [Solirubrobacteraceae bacterium]